ncbi:YcxB family protein [Defluviimonas sp. WL0075]|uniref:YcxB family protein n=1 Tax=Albidovulum sediminicola TaxID=2984331 RepID=A0ABT2Z122_9RHOB|nr:YcxB family protein [Defluviimonas sp. WL0075]MCV2864785.1 YcxB family protein [Defluviimonas sp. WL0075]
MSQPERSFSFTLDGYDHQATCGQLTRRLMPWGLRHAGLLFVVILAIGLLGAHLAVRLGYRSRGFEFFVIFGAAYLFLLAALRRRRERLWQAVADAPTRSGAIALTTSEDGITLASATSRSTVFWPGIIDIIPGKDGLLIMIGAMDYIPIPSRAFRDPTDQQDTLSELRAQLVASRGAAP